MTGGSSNIPILMNMLEKIGFQKDQIKRLEPMHAVAKVAALIGAHLDEQTKSKLPSIKLTEICPLSIGINVFSDLFSPIILRGTKIPCSVSRVFYNCENDQHSMDFDIYEGERKLVKENNILSHFTLYGLPKGVAGSMAVKLTLTIDEDGILHAKATHNDLVAMLDEKYKGKRVDSAKADQMIADAETHWLADSQAEKRVKKKIELNEAIERSTNERILEIYAQFENWLTENGNSNFEQLKAKTTF